jgi:hypothetical protein
MHRREWICRKCVPTYPCRKVFVSHDGVWSEMPEEELRHCISPFHRAEYPHEAEFVEVERR